PRAKQGWDRTEQGTFGTFTTGSAQRQFRNFPTFSELCPIVILGQFMPHHNPSVGRAQVAPPGVVFEMAAAQILILCEMHKAVHGAAIGSCSTRLRSTPRPSIAISTTSPARKNRGGV